jgi:class 3 adenylate cyclase
VRQRSPYRLLKVLSRVFLVEAIALISVVMGFRFYLMLYYPGTPQTMDLFKSLLPHWGQFTYITNIIRAPLDAISPWLQSTLPPHISPWLIGMPAAKLAATLNPNAALDFPALYPGTAELNTLLTIPFWTILFLTIHKSFWYLVDHRDDLAEIQKPMASLAKPKPDSGKPSREALKNLSRNKENSQANPSPGQSSQVPPTAPSTNEKVLERLSQSKNLSLNIPGAGGNRPGERQYTQADWEKYKQQEGDMMVRHMIRGLQQENARLQDQQANLRSTFSQYFSADVLQYLENNKGAFQNIENQKHIVSVLFCDIRGFSAYSQSSTSDELVRFLGEYFEIASYYILHKHHGVISKLMGDGLMAYWGFPIRNDDHAFVATQAALDILREVNLRNTTRPDSKPIQMGIGIATGEVVVGNIGSMDFKDFTLIGVPVNLASRLDEANKDLGSSLLISGNTYRALGNRIACRDLGEISIRNWQGVEHVYAPKLD